MSTADETTRAMRLMKAAPKLAEALTACVWVMERELEGLRVIQPELQLARSALAELADDEPQARAYAEGRKDEREELLQAIQAAGFDLRTASNGQVFLLNVQEPTA